MRDLLDRRLAQLQRRRSRARIVAGLLPTLAITASMAACVVVVVRLAVPSLAWLVWPVVALGLLAPLLRVPRMVAVRESPGLLAGRLDRLAGADGVVMALAAAGAEARDPDWLERVRHRLETLRQPALAFPAWHLAVFGVAAAVGAAFLPQRVPPLAGASAWDALVRGSERRLATLEEAGVLSEPAAEDLGERLERLGRTAGEQGMSELVWEGLDRVDREAADHAQAAARRLAEALAQAERSAEARVDPATTRQELQQLARSLADLQRQAPGLVPQAMELPPGLAQALQDAQAGRALTPEQRAALRAMGLPVEPGPGGEIDPAAARAAARRLAQQLEDYSDDLDRLGLRPAFERALGAARRPGRGGLARGPGHSALELSNRGREEAGEADGLPPGARLNADGSVTLAETTREADLDEAALRELQRARRRSFDPAAADARRVRIAPRHRRAVSSYFGPDGQEGDQP